MNKEMFGIIGGAVALTALLSVGIWYAEQWQNERACIGYSEATGKPTKYLAMECYIKDGAEWYAWSEYKYRLAARGQMKQL